MENKFSHDLGEKGGVGMMFTSEFEHTIDAKSRMFIPAKYREFVGSSVFLCKWTEGNLYIMTVEGWDKYKDSLLEKLPATKYRNVLRRLFGWAIEVPLDSQGRILIPQSYMEHAGLTDRAIIVGCGTKAEIWSPERWKALNDSIDEEELIDILSEKEL